MTTPAEDDRRFPTRGRPLVAFVDGWNRTLHAPAVTVGLLLTSPLWILLLSAAGPVLVMGSPGLDLIRELVSGHALFADYGMWLQTSGNARAVALAVLACVVIAVFLSGGVLDRLARARGVGSAAFFSACGGYAGRLLRLTVPFLVVYWWLFVVARDYFLRFAGSAGDLGLLIVVCAVTLVHDFARVRIVVEDRRSAIGAIAASLRFIRRRFWRVSALYLINVLVLVAVYQAFLSAEAVALRTEWLTLLTGLLSLLFRAWLYMSCAASEIAFFQAELAHAGYSARPLPMWPDSPSAEGLRNLRGKMIR